MTVGDQRSPVVSQGQRSINDVVWCVCPQSYSRTESGDMLVGMI